MPDLHITPIGPTGEKLNFTPIPLPPLQSPDARTNIGTVDVPPQVDPAAVEGWFQQNLANPMEQGIQGLKADANTWLAAERARWADSLSEQQFQDLFPTGPKPPIDPTALANSLRQTALDPYTINDLGRRVQAFLAQPPTEPALPAWRLNPPPTLSPRTPLPERLAQVPGFTGPAETAMRARDVATAIPNGPAMQEWDKANGLGETLAALARNPVALPVALAAQSAAPSAASLAGGVAAGVVAGPVGTAAGVGSGSFAAEYLSRFAQELQAASGKTSLTPEELAQLIADNPKLLETADSKATRKAATVAVVDAISGGLAGRPLSGAAKQGVKAIAGAAAKEAATQAGLGMVGEAASQVAADDPLDLKAILAEGIAEVPGGAVEAASNWRHLRTDIPGEPRPFTPIDLTAPVEPVLGDFEMPLGPDINWPTEPPAAPTITGDFTPMEPVPAPAAPATPAPAPAAPAADTLQPGFTLPTPPPAPAPTLSGGFIPLEPVPAPAAPAPAEPARSLDTLQPGPPLPTPAPAPAPTFTGEFIPLEPPATTAPSAPAATPADTLEPGPALPTPEPAPAPAFTGDFTPLEPVPLPTTGDPAKDAKLNLLERLRSAGQKLTRAMQREYNELKRLAAATPAVAPGDKVTYRVGESVRPNHTVQEVDPLRKLVLLTPPADSPAAQEVQGPQWVHVADLTAIAKPTLTLTPVQTQPVITTTTPPKVSVQLDLPQLSDPAPASIFDASLATIDKLQGHLRGKTFADPLGLTALVDTALTLVRTGLQAGKALETAIREAIAQLKSNGELPIGENELAARLRTAVAPTTPDAQDLPLRARAEKLLDRTDVAGKLRDTLERIKTYTPVSTAEQDAASDAVINAVGGPETMVTRWAELDPDLPAVIKPILWTKTLDGLISAEVQARQAGDAATAERYAEAASIFAADRVPESTITAQTLRMYGAIGRQTPAGWEHYARRLVERATRRTQAQMQPTVEALTEELQQVNREVLTNLPHDGPVQEAATAAIDQGIGQSPETDDAARDTAADGLGPKIGPIMRQHRRGQGKGTLAQQLELALGLSPEEAQRVAKQAEEDYAKRLAELQASYNARIQTERAAARERARREEAEYAKAMAALRKHFRERIAAAKAAGRLPYTEEEAYAKAMADLQAHFRARIAAARKRLGPLMSDSALDQAIRRQLEDMRIVLGALVKQHFSTVDATAKDLVDALVAKAKLPPAVAQQFAQRVLARFSALAAQRKAAALAKLTGPGAKHIKRPALIQRIITATNLGGFNGTTIQRQLAAALHLPQLTPQQIATIRQQALALQTLPAGSLQAQQLQRQLMRLIRIAAQPSKWDIFWAGWYAHLLSGPETHLRNILSNLSSLTAGTLAATHGNPLNIPRAFAGLVHGAAVGWREAASVMREGAGAQLHKFDESGSALEDINPGQFTGAYYLRALRYIGRALASADALTYFPAREAKAQMFARSLARQRYLSGHALEVAVRQYLGESDAAGAPVRPALQQQLTTEAAAMRAAGLTPDGLWRARREQQLIDARRHGDLAVAADQFALNTTFNNEAYGLLGTAANVIHQGSAYLDRTVKSGGAPAVPALAALTLRRFVVPFVNIVANVANEALNYTPVAFGRAALAYLPGPTNKQLNGRPVTKDAALDLVAKGALGTLLLGSLAMKALANAKDDDGRNFQLYGGGPQDKGRRDAMRQAGWIPYSVRLNGRYYTYQNSVTSIGLAILGNYLDAFRYSDALNQASAVNRAAWALREAGHVILTQSFLDGLADMLGEIDRPGSPRTAGDRMAQTLAKGASSIVFPNLLRQIDRIWDPTRTDDKGLKAGILATIPFARRVNQPALNALGEPISPDRFASFSSGGRDNLWATLMQANALPTPPDQGLLTTDEYHSMLIVRGKILRPSLERLADTIENLPDGRAQQLVTALGRRATRAAKGKLGLIRVEAQRKAQATEEE
jgi:hypothetical protein